MRCKQQRVLWFVLALALLPPSSRADETEAAFLDCDGLKTRDAYEAVAQMVGLSDDDKRELLPSGKRGVVR